LAAAGCVACLCAASVLWWIVASAHAPKRWLSGQPASNFAVLETAATPDDSLPQEVVGTLVSSSEPEFTSADIRSARRVLADKPTWLIRAANGELCLVGIVYPLTDSALRARFTPTVTRECAAEGDAESGHLVGTQSLGVSVTTSVMARVVGVVPNGTASVVIVARDRQSVSAAVERNAYEAIVQEPVAVTFTTYHGDHRDAHEVTLATFNKRNARPNPHPATAVGLD
jgi:hypothetical protein